jgi:hypothetical protein
VLPVGNKHSKDEQPQTAVLPGHMELQSMKKHTRASLLTLLVQESEKLHLLIEQLINSFFSILLSHSLPLFIIVYFLVTFLKSALFFKKQII